MWASNYLETAIINLMRGTALAKPANGLYVGLFLTDPTDSGTEGTEVNYSGYARMPVTFQMDGNSAISNSAAITFAEASASVGSPVTHIGIFDSLTGASGSTHMWLYGQLVTSLNIQANVAPIFRAGSIKWTMSGNISSEYKTNILQVIRGYNSSVSAFTPYIGLCNGDPNSGGSEFIGNDYARIAVTFDSPSTDSDAATATTTSNTTDISSPNPAAGYWGVLNYAGIYTASSGGSLFASVPLGTSYTMNEGSVAGFREGQLTFSVN